MGDAGGAGQPAGQGFSRRALLLGGVGTALAGGTAYALHDDVLRWWWRLPGRRKPRTDGAVDHTSARWVPAAPANWRQADRPDDYPIDRVVVHVVQGGYTDALRVFQSPLHGAAAHYVVRKDGQVAQTVRELDVAYHAGNRAYNERSIGIEHEGYVDRPASFTPAMYASSARLTAGICRRYGFPADRQHIVGHVEVPGADHTDPGPHWNWRLYLDLVRAELRRPSPTPGA
ncbi:N-acetylmuramoyl-L-alanine amidase [Streptomyces sp. NPDC052496]|uniref:N-acetylmuramoyl-L-alanine amidase n=1 Tax=Streptomyces sp. NPDC052496 TaxID=3154951 RepID=UPI003446BF61